MSGFLGSLMGAAPALPGILTQVLGTAQGAAGGGLPALLQQLEAAGLGTQMRSWIGQGENMPVAPEQLANAFSPEQVQSWADQAGTTPEAILKVLSEALPHAVDHATPDGEVPPPNAPPPDFGALIGRLLGR